MSSGCDEGYMVGPLGSWIKGQKTEAPPSLSFLHEDWKDLESWKKEARNQFRSLICSPAIDTGLPPEITVDQVSNCEGLRIEKLRWQLPFGPETEAFFLKPEGVNKPLPGILGFHDHGGMKYFGKQKITRTGKDLHPLLSSHQQTYYGGTAWANELARRGYAVLVHDIFPFESRRILPSQLPAHVVDRMMANPETVRELTPEDIDGETLSQFYEVAPAGTAEEIHRYDAFAARHEEIIAKSLFSAGISWPGVCLAEDLFALDYLCSREDIDSSRVGCCGLSGGGLRTCYLAGLDDRIRCSVTAGFMTSWQDFSLHKCFTHTWMIYIPMLPNVMDFPDILGMRAPLPSFVCATREDPLFTLEEVEKSAAILASVYKKAGAEKAFQFKLYDGPHKFDQPMQKEAFAWLDRWLS